MTWIEGVGDQSDPLGYWMAKPTCLCYNVFSCCSLNDNLIYKKPGICYCGSMYMPSPKSNFTYEVSYSDKVTLELSNQSTSYDAIKCIGTSADSGLDTVLFSSYSNISSYTIENLSKLKHHYIVCFTEPCLSEISIKQIVSSSCGSDTIIKTITYNDGADIDNSTFKELSIYPIPTSGVINIDGLENYNDYSYSVYNSIGNVVQKGQLSNKLTLTIDKGIYHLRIKDDKGNHYRQKVIIQK